MGCTPYPISRWVVTVSLLLAGSLLVGMATVMWRQPILADEWDFYRAATHWWQARSLIPHPQAYIHLVQLSFLFFGRNIGSARLVGVFTALVNLALIPFLVRAFFGSSEQSLWIAVGAIWLYSLNPMTVQNMMLLDIDNTLLVPVLLGVLWIWKAGQRWPSHLYIAALGLALAVALWVKLPTPILLAGCLLLFHLFRSKFKQVGELILAMLVGGAVFLLTFGVYSKLTGFTFALFAPTLGKAPADFNAVPTMLLRFPQSLGLFILWLSLPLTFLSLVAITRSVIRLVQRQDKDYDLLAIYVVATVLFYALVIPPAWGYPRYQAPVIPTIAILAASILVSAFQTLPRRLLLLLGCCGTLVFAYNLFIIGDPFWSLYAVTFETDTGHLMYRLNQGLSDTVKLAVPIIVALIFACLFSLRWKSNWLSVAILTLGILALACMLSTTLIQVQADYSTRYRYTYDYADLRQTIANLKSVGGYVIAEKSVFWHAGLPGEEIHGYLCPGCSPQALLERMHEVQVNALAWTTKEAARSPDVLSDPAVLHILETCYTRLTHGVFTVYIRLPDMPCP